MRRLFVSWLRPSGLWRGPLATYHGVRLLAASIPLLVLLTSVFALAQSGLLSSRELADAQLTPRFVVEYWGTRKIRLLFLITVWSVVFVFNAFEDVVTQQLEADVSIAKHGRERLLERLGTILSVVLLISAVLFFPYLHLATPGWMNLLLVIGAPVVTMLGIYLSTRPAAPEKPIRRIGSTTYASDRVFAIATAAQVPIEAQEEIEYFARLRQISSFEDKTYREYLSGIGTGPGHWNGIDRVFQDLSHFLGIPSPHSLVRCDSATQAAELVLSRIIDANTYVVTSSFEYESVLNVALRLAPEKGAEVRIIGKEEKSPIPSPIDAVQRIRDVAVQASKDGKKVLVLVSQVHHDTGLILPIDDLRDWRTANQGVLVVDGAQAVGNIEVSTGLFEWADAYFFSGHKWLGGAEKTGWIVVSPNAVAADGTQLQAALRGLAPFRGYYGDARSGRDLATENLAPLISLGVTLSLELQHLTQGAVSKHGRSLAALFARYAAQLNCVVPTQIHSGLLKVRLPMLSGASIVRGNLARENYMVDQLDDQTLRIAFARHHSSLSVLALAKALARVLGQLPTTQGL